MDLYPLCYPPTPSQIYLIPLIIPSVYEVNGPTEGIQSSLWITDSNPQSNLAPVVQPTDSRQSWHNPIFIDVLANSLIQTYICIMYDPATSSSSIHKAGPMDHGVEIQHSISSTGGLTGELLPGDSMPTAHRTITLTCCRGQRWTSLWPRTLPFSAEDNHLSGISVSYTSASMETHILFTRWHPWILAKAAEVFPVRSAQEVAGGRYMLASSRGNGWSVVVSCVSHWPLGSVNGTYRSAPRCCALAVSPYWTALFIPLGTIWMQHHCQGVPAWRPNRLNRLGFAQRSCCCCWWWGGRGWYQWWG